MTWRLFRKASAARVIVVDPKDTQRLEKRGRKNAERLLKAGVIPRSKDGWCTKELQDLSDKLRTVEPVNVTPIRKVKA